MRDSISHCDVCKNPTVVLIDDSEIAILSKRAWPKIYYCKCCGAAVGCHPGTTRPLGLMADGFTRKLRAVLHEKIDPLWKSGIATRTEIYVWLAKELELDEGLFHVSQLTQDQLTVAIAIATKYHDLNIDRIEKAYRDRRYYKNRR